MKKILVILFNFFAVSAFAQNAELLRSLNAADSLSMAKNFTEADKMLSEIIKAKPDWAVAYAKRAIVRVNLKQLTESRDDIVKAQDLDATNHLVVAAKKKYDEAIEVAPNIAPNAAPNAAPNSAPPQNAEKPQIVQTDTKADPKTGGRVADTKFENPANQRPANQRPAVQSPQDNVAQVPRDNSGTQRPYSTTTTTNTTDWGCQTLTHADPLFHCV